MATSHDGPELGAPDPRIARAAQGDREAAQSLLVELLPRVRNLVRYLVRGDADVDDIAQLALVQLLNSLHNYRGEGSLGRFSDRITSRVALAYVKRKRTEAARAMALGPDLQLVSPHGAADEYTQRRSLVSQLDELPTEQREAIVMRHVMGLTVAEVADELGVPFETARSRLRLGMEKLRQKYTQGETP